MAEFFQVGGSVRDGLLGLKSKDIDYSVEAASYADMREAIIRRGGEIFLEQEKFLTIRAKVPQLGACDYVLCRKDGSYDTDGRRPDFVEVGTLEDDLNRRDFTVNAMALDERGKIIDFHNGREHLEKRLLVCVGNTEKRFTEDSLRMLRAIRFAITKGFRLSDEIDAILRDHIAVELLHNISTNRIRDELFRCFEHDTLTTMQMLERFWRLRNIAFSKGIWLKPTVRD